MLSSPSNSDTVRTGVAGTEGAEAVKVEAARAAEAAGTLGVAAARPSSHPLRTCRRVWRPRSRRACTGCRWAVVTCHNSEHQTSSFSFKLKILSPLAKFWNVWCSENFWCYSQIHCQPAQWGLCKGHHLSFCILLIWELRVISVHNIWEIFAKSFHWAGCQQCSKC